MRTVGVCQKAIDMMCERALSRETQGGILADKQMVQSDIADSYAELMQFRLLVLYTAWQIDRYKDYRRVRKDIATIKVLTPKVLHDIVWRAMHVHGALGVSNEMPLGGHVGGGADHGHWSTARARCTRSPRPARCSRATSRRPACGRPSTCPRRREEAKAKLAAHLEHAIANA